MKKVIRKQKDFKTFSRRGNGELTIMLEYQPISETMGWCLSHVFRNNPDINEVRDFVNGYYNQETSNKILSGMTYNGKVVWLSSENQQNYKSFYDLAKQSDGKNLPVTIKVGDDGDYSYVNFETVEELEDFYLGVYAHIQDCLKEGWAKKDAVDWTLFQ